MPQSKLAHYRDVLNFDRTKHIPFTKQYRIQCSRCEALVINNVPCHETGCPQATSECRGCDAVVPTNVRYCEDCR